MPRERYSHPLQLALEREKTILLVSAREIIPHITVHWRVGALIGELRVSCRQ